MISFLKKIFTWWNRDTFGTNLKTLLTGKLKGVDSFGNKYYENKKGDRWVIYFDEKNTYHHIGIYQYEISTLKKFINLKQTENEKKFRLEQLRALDNGIQIDVMYTKNSPIGVDTMDDFMEIKKIMEYKKD